MLFVCHSLFVTQYAGATPSENRHLVFWDTELLQSFPTQFLGPMNQYFNQPQWSSIDYQERQNKSSLGMSSLIGYLIPRGHL